MAFTHSDLRNTHRSPPAWARRALALAALVASATLYAQPGGSAPAAKKVTGYVDFPRADVVVADTVVVRGWALATAGIERIEVASDGGAPANVRYGLARPDVAKVIGTPGADRSGFEYRVDYRGEELQRHELTVSAVARDGTTAVLGRRSIVPPAALSEWTPRLKRSDAKLGSPFYFLMMTSGVVQAHGADEIDAAYRPLVSRTVRVGMSVPILYMRTTTGAKGDWSFDPRFDLSRKCGNRPVADDNLQDVIAVAIAKRLPVQFILNGGIWGDASCESREWDLTDHLQLDDLNVQWSQDDRTFPDDYLKNLAGSTQSPLLARSLTYNVHATRVRAYKRRNLQAASRIVARFGREHPELFVGVALDSDTYMNPFYRQREVFDYNPGMLRQFREWLRGSGAYAGAPPPGVPDLRAYRRKPSLTLDEVNALAGGRWTSWDQVQPPRRFPGFERDPLKPGEQPVWKTGWWQEWEHFRKHIVDLHYDELSTWAKEAGIPADRIYAAQGFLKPDPGLAPFALHVASRGQNYDSAGVSVEGAIPTHGRLGAIVYGEAARNEVIMETGRTMFNEFARLSPGWGVVEFNSADLKRPDILPGYDQAYRTFRDMFNYDASEVSAMAWNGMNGLFKDQPGYVSYTSWRNTAAEDAMRDFLVSHADVPRGAQLWTFGTGRIADLDGWQAISGTIVAGKGYLQIQQDKVEIASPRDLVVRPRRISTIELIAGRGTDIVRVAAYARAEGETAWRRIGSAQHRPSIALAWPREWLRDGTLVEQVKLDLELRSRGGERKLRRIALYPACAAISCRATRTTGRQEAAARSIPERTR